MLTVISIIISFIVGLVVGILFGKEINKSELIAESAFSSLEEALRESERDLERALQVRREAQWFTNINGTHVTDREMNMDKDNPRSASFNKTAENCEKEAARLLEYDCPVAARNKLINAERARDIANAIEMGLSPLTALNISEGEVDEPELPDDEVGKIAVKGQDEARQEHLRRQLAGLRPMWSIDGGF